MATYKIPQNVEAEDKLLGPFTFKQFIFLIAATLAILLAVGLWQIQPVLITIPLPIIIVFLILGLYRREDQPVETYLLAALNFFIKPRKRLWDPVGLIETVRITAPKKIAQPKEKNLAQEYSQLQRLARIVDTRGWVAKRPELTEPTAEHELDNDDRLTTQAQPSGPEPLDIHASDDMLDTYNNPRARDFENLERAAQAETKQTAITKMQQAVAATKPPQESSTSNASIQIGQARTETPLPDNVKYNPYPAIHQKVINPNLTISEIAAQANKNQQLAAGS